MLAVPHFEEDILLTNQLEIIKLFIMKIGRVILIIPDIKSLKLENGKIVLKKLNML